MLTTAKTYFTAKATKHTKKFMKSLKVGENDLEGSFAFFKNSSR